MLRFIFIIVVDFNDSMSFLRVAANIVTTTAANAVLPAAQPDTRCTAAQSFVFMRLLAMRFIEFVQKRLFIRCRYVNVAGQTAAFALPRRHRRIVLLVP